MPILGLRFFGRSGYITSMPTICARSFVDANGDVAMLALPILLGTLLIPLTSPWGQLTALGLVAFVGFALPTNQIHKWAHLSAPPQLVRWLQNARLI